MNGKNSFSLITFLILTVCLLHTGFLFFLSELSIPHTATIKKSTFNLASSQNLQIQKEERKKREEWIAQALENLALNEPKTLEIIEPEELLYEINEESLLSNLSRLPLDSKNEARPDYIYENDEMVCKDECFFCSPPESAEHDLDLYLIQPQISGSTIMIPKESQVEKSIPIGHTISVKNITLNAEIAINKTNADTFYFLEDNPFQGSFSGNMMEAETFSLQTNPLDIDSYCIDDFGVLPSSNDFDVTVEYAPKKMQSGFIFKASFIPKKGTLFKRIRQNFYFLLDRSNSIAKTRYELSKQAIDKSLKLLHPDDTFNILIFDDKIVKLSPQNLSASVENKEKAGEFLQRHPHGGLFAATDIYASLGKIIPKEVPDTEVNVAVLLSDGDTYLNIEQQRQMIGRFTEGNAGKVSLFCLASGDHNNLALLDLLSTFNKGQLIFSSAHDQIEFKLSQLIRYLQNPIGKSMVATAVTESEKTSVQLYPRNIRLPNLYEGRAFIIYGSISKLEDFTLFLQGKYYDRKFDIKKKIVFNQAQMGTPNLERQWTLFQAHDYLENFFHDGNMVHIEKAKQLLTPLNLTVPFTTQAVN